VKSESDIGCDVFGECCKLKSVTIPDLAAGEWDYVFGKCKPTEINVKTPTLLPEEMQPAAMVGYANNPDAGDTERKRLHMEYIRAHAEKLLEKALECPALMRIILKNKLVEPETAEKCLVAAAELKLTEITEMLLEYTKDSTSSGNMDS